MSLFLQALFLFMQAYFLLENRLCWQKLIFESLITSLLLHYPYYIIRHCSPRRYLLRYMAEVLLGISCIVF